MYDEHCETDALWRTVLGVHTTHTVRRVRLLTHFNGSKAGGLNYLVREASRGCLP